MSENRKAVSSPNSAGGGGTHFEQHVDAAFLAWLLVRAIPPVLTDCTLSAIHLQAERLGWETDDLVVVATNGAGIERKLVCQVKQTVKVSAEDTEFRKTITDAWVDFKNIRLFDQSRDRFAIITLRGTEVLLRYFAGLLDVARTSRSAKEFRDRMRTDGLVDKKTKIHLRVIKSIIRDIEGRDVDEVGLWEFIRLLHILSFDLNTSTSQTEAQVKSILAHTAGGQDPISAANATWNELLREVGEGKPHAKSYGREDLAQELRDRHSPISNHEQASLQRLKEHSQPILASIRTTIGLQGSSIELPRERLVHAILERIQDSNIILISGSAGSGKSAVAKRVLEHVAPDYFTFSFRAEEFAVSHLDEVLHKAQANINGVTLGAILSGQSKKVLLIESVERMLEAPKRDAFGDLLSQLPDDSSWRLILTCRDYSTDLIRSSLLQAVNAGHAVVSVPPLDDTELDAVAAACPALSQALAHHRLRKLLRNPYMLDKATQMAWSENRPLPENERAFREKFWAEVVRVNHFTFDGMPRRRQEAFVEVALRRARALTMYASRDGLDDEALTKLIYDSLVNTSERTDSLVAPAHDVLEDWAILKWIDEQYIHCSDDLSNFAEVIGGFPALRRSLRKWLEELNERDSSTADILFTQALTVPSIRPQFRDDTLVSLLRSSDPRQFLERHVDLLLSDNKRLLRRIIHLLRVGCVVTPEWFEGGHELDFNYYVPDGIAWPCVLKIICSRLTEFSKSDTSLLLGLIENAAKGVSWQTPYPPGSESIVSIAYWLIPHFSDYGYDEQLTRTLQVIAKLPKCEESRFRLMLLKKKQDSYEKRDRAARKFGELILSGIDGDPACRDMPELIIELLRDRMFMTEKHIEESREFGFYSSELEPRFGIRSFTRSDAFPPSAYQGPFFFLLRHHFVLATQFLIELVNHSSEWYGNQRVPLRHLETPYKIKLQFSDGQIVEQWANKRLWNMYRGTSVGPYILQSALMALEKQLLDVRTTSPEILDNVLIGILRASKSAAITAIVASVATADPSICPETLFVLLRSRACLQLDLNRRMDEVQRPSRVADAMPSLSNHKTHNQERKQADSLPHRDSDLENAIQNLQFGPIAARVHEIIDEHLQNIPPAEHRTEEDRIWLLALRRMDLRRYEIDNESPSDEETNANVSANGDLRNKIRLNLRIDEPDLREMAEEATVKRAEPDVRIGLLMWGMNVFEGQESTEYDPSLWRSKLQIAQSYMKNGDSTMAGAGGYAFVAAICIRDHFSELTKDETHWCVEAICAAIEETADDWDRIDRMQQYSLHPDRPGAWAVSALINKPLSDELAQRVRSALVLAMTHSNDEVRIYAADGISRNLWGVNDDLAIRCVNVIALEAATVQSALNVDQEKTFDLRMGLDSIEYNVGVGIRSQFWEELSETHYDDLDISDWIGSEANCRILHILQRVPYSPMAVSVFRRSAEVLATWWDEDRNRKYDGERRERSSKAQVALPSLLENFVLRVDTSVASEILKPILESVDTHPQEVSNIILGIIAAEDRIPSKTNFWPIWQLFADRIKQAQWIAGVDRRYSAATELYYAIFLTQHWKQGIRHWNALSEGTHGGNAYRVNNLFDALPPTSILLDSYVRFLYHIGETCLPSAFERLAEKLRLGDPNSMLRRPNTVFILESLLRRFVHSRPIELKSKASMRDAVLYLLDALVEAGSSSAYRMRDDFVTPLSIIEESMGESR